MVRTLPVAKPRRCWLRALSRSRPSIPSMAFKRDFPRETPHKQESWDSAAPATTSGHITVRTSNERQIWDSPKQEMEIGSAAADGGDGCRAGSLVATSPATFPRFATGGISGSHLLERTLVLVIHKKRTYYGPHLTCREAASLLGACAVAIPTAV